MGKKKERKKERKKASKKAPGRGPKRTIENKKRTSFLPGLTTHPSSS
jgi:hypothetical protein